MRPFNDVLTEVYSEIQLMSLQVSVIICFFTIFVVNI
jgi:hypothetical protein